MNKNYILDLEKFVENDFAYIFKDNILTVREDNEISYEYDMNRKKYLLLRGEDP